MSTPSRSLEHLAATGAIHPSWCAPLAPVQQLLERAWQAVSAEREAGTEVLPESPLVLRAFRQPFEAVRVVILGQDPYPTPGHPVGLAFSVDAAVRPLPRSLQNILIELNHDQGVAIPASGDLSPWEHRGVLLLNSVLTVRAGQPLSHRDLGWQPIVHQALAALDARPQPPLVAVLWGAEAQKAARLLPNSHLVLSAHPSPLSAHRGFFGSRPFSRVNDALISGGSSPIDWSLE
jgi:uracil-DNA glycosylase